MMRIAFQRYRFCTALCVVILLLLSACVDLTTDIELNSDGSGSIALSYTASRAMINLGTIDEQNRFYAIPVSEDDFLAAANQVEGLSLESFRLSEEVDMLTIEATLDFESVEALSGLFGSSGPGAIEITDDGNITIYRHTIYGGAEGEIDPESRDLIETFFSEDEILFSLEAPAAIQSVSTGTFSGRVARSELMMTDILFSQEPVIWEVRW